MVIGAFLLLCSIIHLVATMFGAPMAHWEWWLAGILVAGVVKSITNPVFE